MKFLATFQLEIDAKSHKEAERILIALNGFIWRCASLFTKFKGVELKSLRPKVPGEKPNATI